MNDSSSTAHNQFPPAHDAAAVAGNSRFGEPPARGSRMRGLVALLAVVLPLAVGAVIAAIASLGPADSWSSAEEPTGAPAVENPGVDTSKLVDARRAAGQASSQAGILQNAIDELIGELEGVGGDTQELAGAVGEAADGADRLRQGLVELQAGTGQLGNGASELANGVGQAVDQVVGFGAVQGQLVEAADRAITELRGVDAPEAKQAISDLESLRRQVENFNFQTEVADDLLAMKKGSRDLANQLNVPGYGFHDGVYELTNGSKNLSAGLQELRARVDEATAGLGEFDSGAERLETMAQSNKQKSDAVSRAIPAGPRGEEGAEEQAAHGVLPPVVAMLVAALVMLAGVVMAVMSQFFAAAWAVQLGGGVLAAASGAVLVGLLGDGLTVATVAIAAGVSALSAWVAAGFTWALMRIAGMRVGIVIAAVAGIAQVGVVGWVWQAAASAEIAQAWSALAGLLPLHWSTTALSTIANDGESLGLWIALVALAVSALVGVVAAPLLNRRRMN
ncbi:hypothetical protein [Corynebacterium propinquum]